MNTGSAPRDFKPASAPGEPAQALLSYTDAIVLAMRRALPAADATASQRLQGILAERDDTAQRGDAPAGWHRSACREMDQSPGLRVVAFYLPPWEAWLRDPAGPGRSDPPADHGPVAGVWMRQWRDFHARLLDLRTSRPERVALINAGRLDADSLVAMLEAAGHGPVNQVRVHAAIESIPPVVEPVARLLASVMAEQAPECWEMYEQLESCALVQGREPEFRACVPLPDVTDLEDVLAAVREIQAAMVDRQESGGHASPAGPIIDELQDENELLTLQIEQLHEELEFQVKAGSRMHAMLEEAGDTAETARQLITRLLSR